MQRREKGTGTIVQRDSGTWSGRVSIGRGDDGKIKYKYFSGKTEAEVKKKIREYNKSGCPQDAPQILFKDYLFFFLLKSNDLIWVYVNGHNLAGFHFPPAVKGPYYILVKNSDLVGASQVLHILDRHRCFYLCCVRIKLGVANCFPFETLDLAIQKYPDAHPLFHSDRGSQYTGERFISFVRQPLLISARHGASPQ